MKKFFKDLFCSYGTNKISLTRVVFVLGILLCVYTTIKWKIVLTEWVVILTTILPYLYFNKKLTGAQLAAILKNKQECEIETTTEESNSEEPEH